jgi:hypothetical protein
MKGPDQERHGKNQHHGGRSTRQNSLMKRKWKRSSRLQMALVAKAKY